MATAKQIAANKKNAKLGGRPKGYAALEAERQRAEVAHRLVTEFTPIVTKAIEQAKGGDKSARDWLSDFAYGKPTQRTELTAADGKDLFPSEQDKKIAAAALDDL